MVYQLAKKDKRIFFIGSDLGAGTLQNFKEEMPDRFFMEGISEANIIGMATGLAMEGKIPYVCTITAFLTRRCYEQIVIDMCLHRANVRLIGIGGGLVYGMQGPTHYVIEDIAILRALPNMTIVAPADANEMKHLMPLTVDYEGPIYIRLGRGDEPIVTDEKNRFEIGKAFPMRNGQDALIITTGITLKIALDVSESLNKEGIEVGVLHVPTIKPLDEETIIECTKNTPIIITLEEHSRIGGLGSAIAELITEANFTKRKLLRRIGIPDIFPDKYLSQGKLMVHCGISSKTVCSSIKELLQVKRRK
jgi:transketolase